MEEWINLNQLYHHAKFWNEIRENWLWNGVELNWHELNKFPIHSGEMAEDFVILRERLFVLYKKSNMSFVNDSYDQGNINSEDSSNNYDPVPCMFMLSGHYYILEYRRRGTQEQSDWMELRSIKCRLFELPPLTTPYNLRMHACGRFVLVVAFNYNESEDNADHINHEGGWFYDLSINK